MGTRGTYGFASNTKVKLSYNHFDSWPEGLGKEIVAFIRKVNAENGWAKLRMAVDKCIVVDENAAMDESEARQYFPKKKSFPKLPIWYEAMHHFQNGKILDAVYTGEVKHITDGSEFPKNSHFCEYCYVIDLNRMAFDIYVGKQKQPDKNSHFGQTKNEEGFYPCKIVVSWRLDAIPEDWDKEIDKIVKDNEKALLKAA
jgi:hypothetical protein